MDPADDDIYTIAGRLATFERPHHFNKRRASQTTAKKKAQPTSITWPHASPNPEQLARAGFYYRPASTSHDSVSCFLCDKSLDGWDPDDNPALEHLSHVPDCGWAINICIEQRSHKGMDPSDEEHPLSEKMCDARRATFRDAWPHQSKKGWKCKLDKMVEAGWSYNPLPGADDCVQCFYCGVSLDGWEPKDDPWEEHQRRAPDCHFFSLVDQAPKPKAAPKTKGSKAKSKAKASRTSRTSRASTQSNLTQISDVTSLDLGESLPPNDDENDDSVVTVVSTTSKTGAKGRKKAAPSSKSRATRNKKNSTVEDSVMQDIEATALEQAVPQNESVLDMSTAVEADSSQLPAKKGRTTRTKKASTAKSKAVIEEPADIPSLNESIVSITAPDPLPQPKTRTKKQTMKKTEDISHEPAQELPQAEDAPEPPAPTRKVSKAKPSKKKQDNIPEVQQPPPEEMPQPKKRGKKRTNEGVEKADSSTVSISEETAPEPPQPKPEPAKRGRAASRTTKKVAAPEPEAQVDDSVKTPEEPMQPPKDEPNPKARTARSSRQTHDNEAPVEAVPEQLIEPSQPQAEHHLPEQSQSELPTPPTPPAEVPLPSVASSPQSSDAENHPPSSRPSVNTAGESAEEVPIRVPLKPSTPTASPSKRNIIAGITSAAPWTAVDLETVFLPSPTSRAAQGEEEKENLSVDSVMQRLTSPEKKMSVEEWILWNASRAEEKLKTECERLIGSFEGEGVRALQALEGIDCVS